MRAVIMASVVFASCLAGVPSFGAIQAVITADNHYGLYYGKVDGTSLAYVGRNEGGVIGSPGTYNWSLPETWNFSTADYIYVVAWDDGGPQAWIGEFSLPSGTLLTKLDAWEYYVSVNSSPGTADPPVTLTNLGLEIANATWSTPVASTSHGSSPWGTIAGISASADFIWHDTLSDNSISDGKYVIFRTVNPVDMSSGGIVPEPTTLLIWSILGLLGAVAYHRRK